METLLPELLVYIGSFSFEIWSKLEVAYPYFNRLCITNALSYHNLFLNRIIYPTHNDNLNCNCLYCTIEKCDPMFDDLIVNQNNYIAKILYHTQETIKTHSFDSWILPVFKNKTIVYYINNVRWDYYKPIIKYDTDLRNYFRNTRTTYSSCTIEQFDDVSEQTKNMYTKKVEPEISKYYISINKNTIHCDRKPAIISFDSDNKEIYKCWVKLGKKHRLNGPAESYYGYHTNYLNGSLALNDNLQDSLDDENRMDDEASLKLSEWMEYTSRLKTTLK